MGKTIAIIGAGAAGLSSASELRRAGHDVTVFERRPLPGGLWTDNYDALHLITSRNVSVIDDFPQPAEYPNYPSSRQVAAYLQNFAAERDLLKLIRFNTEVADVAPIGPNGIDGWLVTVDGGTEPERFDVVVVANGHLHHKYTAPLPGNFEGKILHTADYRNAGDIDGSRVLVVGAGNSGCDVAVDAAAARKDVSVSIRHSFVFLPKSLFGIPRGELPLTKLPPVWAERILRQIVRVSVGRPEQYRGLPQPPTRNLRKQRPIVNDLLPYWISHGRISIKPSITRVAGRSVTFSDGATEDFDTVVMATGFRYHAPFLAPGILTLEKDMPRRWGAGVLVHGVANLYFVGLIAPLGAQWPVYGRQARLIADFIELQDYQRTPIVETFQQNDPGFGDLEILRDVWTKDVVKLEKRIAKMKNELRGRRRALRSAELVRS
jgi:cation diffusion facilitator CzcD-associated flavoprotein CzcO